MSKKTNHGVKSAVMEDEHNCGEGCATKGQEKRSPVFGCSPKLDCNEFLTTGKELPDGF